MVVDILTDDIISVASAPIANPYPPANSSQDLTIIHAHNGIAQVPQFVAPVMSIEDYSLQHPAKEPFLVAASKLVPTRQAATIDQHYTLDKIVQTNHEIGKGGMGTLFKARHRETDEELVVKQFMPFEWTQDVLQNIATLMVEIDHPNLVVPMLVDFTDRSYLMSYIPGTTVASGINSDTEWTKAPFQEGYTRAWATILSHLHHKGFVCCDPSPEQLMRTPGGTYKLIDLDLVTPQQDLEVKPYHPANRCRKIPYLAEETLLHRSKSPKSDLQSLGIMLVDAYTREKTITTEPKDVNQYHSMLQVGLNKARNTIPKPLYDCVSTILQPGGDSSVTADQVLQAVSESYKQAA